MDFDFIYIKRSAIEHFSKTLGGIFQKPGWTPNPGWDFPKAWVEFSTTLGGVAPPPPMVLDPYLLIFVYYLWIFSSVKFKRIVYII